jgi:long-subunit fatty acid transport protein
MARRSFQGDGSGFGINAAITIDLTDKQRLVLTYRSSIEVDYEGDSKLTQTPVAAPVPTLVTSRSDFETTIEFPTVHRRRLRHRTHRKTSRGSERRVGRALHLR